MGRTVRTGPSLRAASPVGSRRVTVATMEEGACCPYLHEAVELIGKRWTGAILYVLLERHGPMRFTEIGQAIPQLSDRLLSERVKELEAHGILERRVTGGAPARVEYELTPVGRELEPALRELRCWGLRHFA